MGDLSAPVKAVHLMPVATQPIPPVQPKAGVPATSTSARRESARASGVESKSFTAAAAAEAVRIRAEQQQYDRHSRAQRLEALRLQRDVEAERLEELTVEIRQAQDDARYRRLEAIERVALEARKAKLAKEKRREVLEQMATAHEAEMQARTGQLQAKRASEADQAAKKLVRQEAESDLRAQLSFQWNEIDQRWTQTVNEEHISVARERALEVSKSALQAKRDWEQLLTTRRNAAAKEKKQTRAKIQERREQERQDQEKSNRLAYEKLKADEELRRITAEEHKARTAQERRERREEARKATEEQKATRSKDVQWVASERQVEKDSKKQQRAAMLKHHQEHRQRRIFDEKLHTEKMRLSTAQLHEMEQIQAFNNGLRKKARRVREPMVGPGISSSLGDINEEAARERRTDTAAQPMQYAEPSQPKGTSEIRPESSILSVAGWSHDSGYSTTVPKDDSTGDQSCPAVEHQPTVANTDGNDAVQPETKQVSLKSSAVQPEASQVSTCSQTSLGSSRSTRSNVGHRAPPNPNRNPAAVTITPRQRQLAAESKLDRRKRLAANRQESSAIVAAQAELLKYKSNSEWKGWKAPRPVSPTDNEVSAWSVGASESLPDTASRNAMKAAQPQSKQDSNVGNGEAENATSTEDTAPAPNVEVLKEQVSTSIVPIPPAETQSGVSRMACLEQGIEYRPLQPLALKLRAAAPEEPCTPLPAAHPGAGLFTTDVERGPSNAVAPEVSEEELHLQQPVGPRSLSCLNPRSVAAAIATERAAVVQGRKTSGFAQPSRQTLRPVVDARSSTPRTAAPQILVGTLDTNARHAARIVLAEEWRGKSLCDTASIQSPKAIEPLPLPKQSSAGLPNSSGWHGGCGDWLKSTGKTINKPTFDTGRQSPLAEGPASGTHLPVVADVWPKPPPKPRVQAAKLLRRTQGPRTSIDSPRRRVEQVQTERACHGDLAATERQVGGALKLSSIPVSAR